MSVVGLDVGNENCIVGVARQRGIDVVLNDESKRETPAMVSFSEKQRFLGTAAAASATMNPRNTVSQIKRLIGRRFADPEVQKDLQLLPFNVTEAADGTCLIHVRYLGEVKAFTPTQILGMVLSNLKTIAETNLGTHVVDCVIGIPVYFSDLQRRAYLDAASIAGLHPLRLMHETTATALAYGIYKTDLPEGDPVHVAFVDVGHASTQVCIVAFKKGQLKILGTGFDASLGGRDFDELLYIHFASTFKEEYKIDVRSNPKASLRLRGACEKVKKILSANAVAPISIECLMDEKDVKGMIKREDFEQLAAPLLNRFKSPLEKALVESKIPLEKINSVEVVGSGSRIPAILRILASFFNKEPGRTLNASECIARGCALQCAMLSPTFKVRDFEVQDSFPFPIALSWKGPAPESEDDNPNSIVFVKGNLIPSTKMLTFFRSGTFAIDVMYADTSELPAGVGPKISTFTIGPFTPTRSEKAKIKVKIRLNLHGIVSVESATMVEEEEVEVPVTKEPTAMETDKEDDKGDVPMEEGDAKVESAEGTDNGAPPMEEPVETQKAEPVKKKKTKRTDVPVTETVPCGLPPAELQKAVEKEYEYALQDRVMEETKDRKNAVEAYVYDMRNKLYEKLHDYVTDFEKEELTAKLQQTEDWLYEEGEDEIKSVYVAKLAELKKLGDPIEERQREEENRAPSVNTLLYCINSFREAALSKDPKFDHIDPVEKEKVVVECNKAEEWLRDKKHQQDGLARSVNPVLLSADIKKKAEVLDRFCKPIMTKPKPAPPKAAAPAAEAKSAAENKESKAEQAAGGAPQAEDAGGAADPMDTDHNHPEQEGSQSE
ncbi:heat shock 70 kDa protein 14 [Selaginella moellendorffii]|uniref:heat shock 70 kDa protein 14 n=1 Tax=Selaginella moellendorffii TaxID=88036 RepID=UPI000D1C59C4|nr:heat shock 70 kDa protein 14 [Selaginella moellendorffii]|eukprot:XP_002986462.2 heat shock 70 kDa protein 14 [Selaginella moellendorffii]